MSALQLILLRGAPAARGVALWWVVFSMYGFACGNLYPFTAVGLVCCRKIDR